MEAKTPREEPGWGPERQEAGDRKPEKRPRLYRFGRSRWERWDTPV